MLGDQQQAVQVSLLEPDLPGVGTAALRARGGLRNPWVHKGPLSVGCMAGMMASPRRQGLNPCCHGRQRGVRER